jgi:hypothetical protein
LRLLLLLLLRQLLLALYTWRTPTCRLTWLLLRSLLLLLLL